MCVCVEFASGLSKAAIKFGIVVLVLLKKFSNRATNSCLVMINQKLTFLILN